MVGSKPQLTQLKLGQYHQRIVTITTLTQYYIRWVSTDMGGEEAPITPKDSVTAMLATMKLLSDKDQGAFMHQDKQPIAW